MASIRRTLSPVPRAGTLLNADASSVASPLSKSSSCAQSSPLSGGYSSPHSGALDSHSAFYKLKALIFGISLQRSSRPLERSKPRGLWRKALFHSFICFTVGLFIGLTPFVSMNLSISHMSERQAFSFEKIPPHGKVKSNIVLEENMNSLIDSEVMKNNTITDFKLKGNELSDEAFSDYQSAESLVQNSTLVVRNLLIVVTPTYAQPLQAYYLNRLALTLKLVPPPLLWIVVEMNSQSAETAEMLRRTGIMYRHLVCSKNISDIRDTSIHQRNVALSHIETHHLDGVVYFADDDMIYSIDLFEEIRQIRRFGTWVVPKLMENKREVILAGPICNGTQVIGWHTGERKRRYRRFHADMLGFAFNSTILWDPKRWNRPTLEPIRLLDTVKEGFQVSTFVEQVVEDETQMEGLLQGCSRIMVWHPVLEPIHFFYPPGWVMKTSFDATVPLT